MRNPSIRLGAIAVALVLTASCAASGGDDAASDTTAAPTTEDATTTTEETTTTEATTTTTEVEGAGDVDVDEWAATFCGNFEAWLAAIEAASDDVTQDLAVADLDGARSAILGLFDTASDETEALRDSIDDGGAPAIVDGEGLQAELVTRFDAFNDSVLAARAQLADLPTDDPVVFEDGVIDAVTTFELEAVAIGESFEELDDTYDDPDLRVSLNRNCSF